MKKKFLAVLCLIAILLGFSSCSIPIIGDFIKDDRNLGKSNSSAVTISTAMNEFLAKKKKSDCALYGISMTLNSGGNGTVKLYYTSHQPASAGYEDIIVAEVDSKTGHIMRFSSPSYSKDGITPYRLVKECRPIDASSLPIDSGKAISAGTTHFMADQDFTYDYVQVTLSCPAGTEVYSLDFYSMLNDKTYHCTVDALTGTVMSASSEDL